MLNQTMGDGILALWGVPLPNAEHPLDACRAALAMQARLAAFNREGEAAGRPALKMRIGIQTGEIVVGNIGSAERFSYGTVGDNVNLASRLEGVNKLYGTGIVLGEDTAARVRDTVALRELDLVRVVGRQEPIRVYECLGLRGAVPAEREPALGAFAAGLGAYRDRDWKGALAHFEQALAQAPEDGPSRLYVDRAREFLSEPPPEAWDGVYTARTKEG
jgi:adenylate cyclase